MKLSRLLVGPLAAIGATGCLASKGDIRLLQDELVATRAAVARSDSIHQRQIDSLTAALSTSTAAAAHRDSAMQLAFRQGQQASDAKLGDLSTRVRTDQLATNDKLKAFVDELNQVQEFTRQNARGVTQAKAALEKVQSAAVTGDTTGGSGNQPTPGPASLLVDGNGAMFQGSCRTARRSYEDLLRQYPNALEAPEAQYNVAESFVSCADGGNLAAADSVYTLVTARYPKSGFAATALWKLAEIRSRNNQPDSARVLLLRIVCEYPKSDVAQRATDKLGGAKVCK